MELKILDVSKSYGNYRVLRNISMEIFPGIVGLLGENGAGKSTLMKILSTISCPTEGKVLLNGVDIRKKPNIMRNILGYLPQDFGVYPHLNAVEFLSYIAAIKGIDRTTAKMRIYQLLELVNLSEVKKRPVGNYSGGMKQRLGIAQVLLNDPKIVIVDEPTVGLDPIERNRFRHLLSDISGERIVILSTHIVSDVEAIAGKIAVMSKGQLLSYAKPVDLLERVKNCVWESIISEDELQKFRKEFTVCNTVRTNDGMNVRFIAKEPPNGLANFVVPTLEDAYLALISGGDSNHD
ncbi:ABC transporter ATP-binding protein [Metabacillus endolithicus]|uniref:ABC transporter ATP-binding protein n=1 Tax=Metabacillus endolithicus TaxID=1535204 RepID=A0ABW5BPS0_9BACI|nr:ABC transporter ATP-binding protein [Metabacillus endolithicus]UPG63823.1 ABC transporter ATP-binding protein [Metabacillus endolithicus]